MPIIPYSYNTIIRDLNVPAPAPPSQKNWLGTDDQARDVLARLIYGFRISILFGFTLTFFSMIIGVSAGAVQGYFGGKTDLFFQRFMEIWSAIPALYVLIILASIVQPNFWWLLIILLIFSWMGYVGVVRAEFLRARNFDYVRAAKALGFTAELFETGVLTPRIGNTYSGAIFLGLAAILDIAKPGDRILAVAYGSGAGSDGFDITVTENIEKMDRSETVEDMISRMKIVNYATYAKYRGKLRMGGSN